MQTTLQGRIDAAKGHTTGFDAMRVALAISVIAIHSVSVCYGVQVDRAVNWESPLRGLTSLVLPMFFALSGFLVAGSLERTPRLHQFLTLRVVRIFPALCVETLLCALILGPLLTSVDLTTYFSSPLFFKYFRNTVGDVQFFLPGMFEHTPSPAIVNVSLWTVPFELVCYVLLAFLALTTLTKRRLAFTVAVLGVCAVTPLAHLALQVPQEFYRPHGRVLVMAFLCGILAFQWRRELPHNGWLAAASGVLAVLLLMNSNLHFWAVPFAAYLTAYLGLLQAPKLPVFSRGDYSYGMYLFAFPMQQLYAQIFPHAHVWYLNVGFAVLAALAYAMFSWHCVEKPVLKRRKIVVNAVDRVVVGIGSWAKLLRPERPTPEA